ncbi:hypothetical protein [Tenacibaculum sp. IB213877]|uniref:hypothetical protein n=1 Tax=Tenacibaculum sp. IB213877 TaxID=3097351 RepID=UPI002A59C6FA|nr:hypothetical protein [Tenacibaculum sp. IB213877]MDY0780765.1 hypothetical protein [Tenacibaculum sp. IB213877]
MKRIIISFLLLLLSGFSVFSQVKFEKEYRVSSSEVPQKASEFISQCNFKKKVKWFTEESQDGKTFEAKACHKNHKLSIEFSEKGDLIDVEKTVKFSKLPKEEKELINSVFRQQFSKFRIKKVQLQYTGSDEKILNIIQNNQPSEYNFEVVVKGKKTKSYTLQEFLINQKGEVVKELKFVPMNSDNLEF